MTSPTITLPRETRIGSMDSDAILNAVCFGLGAVIFQEQAFERLGGYLYLAVLDADDDEKFIHEPVGSVDPEKAEKYFVLSREKTRRLRRNHREQGHISSWQSRDVDKSCYGGAIVASGWVISFSGQSEHGDESISLIAALQTRNLDGDQALDIAEYSENQLFLDIARPLFGLARP